MFKIRKNLSIMLYKDQLRSLKLMLLKCDRLGNQILNHSILNDIFKQLVMYSLINNIENRNKYNGKSTDGENQKKAVMHT